MTPSERRELLRRRMIAVRQHHGLTSAALGRIAEILGIDGRGSTNSTKGED